ncbi:hypothetical protein [Streptomyces sp. NPDC059828]|uniref:hypothetical protein n=1 Tax=Streptomyces sp. NPDC059828 TaxID=3346965 RepID=UPI0036699D2B
MDAPTHRPGDGAALGHRAPLAWPARPGEPGHASWLDQVEIYFSAVQRKALSPNGFTDLTEVRDRLRAFEDRYHAGPGRHTADHHEESSVAPAA